MEDGQYQPIMSDSNYNDEEYDYYDYLEYEHNDTYVYEYPLSNGSSSHLNLSQFVPVCIAYTLTLVLGLIGNILVIFCVTRYKRMRNVTNVFLISLSCADLLLVMICVPVKFVAFYSHTWGLGEFMCKAVHYVQVVSMVCSVLTLTTMSLERYYAILWPIQAKYVCTMTHARMVVMVIWVVSFVLAIPVLIGQQLETVVGVRRTAHWCRKIWSPPWAIVYESYMFIILYLVPLGIMTFAYSSICSELYYMTWRRASMRAQTSNGRHSEDNIDAENGHSNGQSLNSHVAGRPLMMRRQSNKDDEKTRKQVYGNVIKMLVAVILLYAICWGPFLINNLLVSVGVLDELHHGWLKPMRLAFNLMAYFNSCINPMVYGFMSKNFRESFKQSLRGCCCVRTPVRQQHMSVRTTSSVTRQMSLKTNVELEKINKKLMINETRTPDTSMVDEAL